jgi:solute:Na+ symporter, SSS family
VNLLDFVVLLGSVLGIAVYGVWRTRGCHNLNTYMKGDEAIGWATIGLSVMATQASAITFMSTPGQGFENGLGFVQFYFGVPLALVIIAGLFLPIYRRWNVYTAYEYLGRRFDGKTRLLCAGLFLVQRGLAAGITIYAPAIILSTMLGWPLRPTIVLSSLVAIIYTAVGGSEAVSLTQRYQMAVIFAGMATAFVILLVKLPIGLGDAFTVAGGLRKLEAVNVSFDIHQRYTLWSGLLGGLFLQLSYFGADQSQVQRYLSSPSLRASRLGLMFNAVFKIPMQFSILLLGILICVFYQFAPEPVLFNRPALHAAAQREGGTHLSALEQEFASVHEQKQQLIQRWLAARHTGRPEAAAGARTEVQEAYQRSEGLRAEAKEAVKAATGTAKGQDADYVFITFVLSCLPHGVIGLLVAAFFAAALSSKAAELNALASTTTVDFYRFLVRRNADDNHYVAASKWFTVLWGLVALAFALFASLQDNLIQAVNIVGSWFYGVLLGLLLVAFFLKRVGGTAVFWAALAAEALVLVLHFRSEISYLWYNPIGCGACVLLSLALQAALGALNRPAQPMPEPR